MYESLLAVAIKNNGKILRENKDAVSIPYGTEYSIFVKNMNSKKASINISIDGTDISTGSIIVDANSSIEIERFITNNDSGNRFKFIEKTADIEDNRTSNIDDGLIRVEFQFEQHVPTYVQTIPHIIYKYEPPRWEIPYTISSGGGILRSTGIDPTAVYSTITTNDAGITTNDAGITTNDAGITVPGSISNQKFTTTTPLLLESEKHVIVMKLLGVDANNHPIEKVVTTRTPQTCVTCKKKNKPSSNFCVKCGTSLSIIE